MRVRPHLCLILIVLALGLLPTVPGAPAQNEDHAVEDDYTVTLNAKFPIEGTSAMYVAYRYSHVPVPDDLEYSFVIGLNPRTGGSGFRGWELFSEVRAAEANSIYEQMKILHRDNPAEPIKKLRVKLKVKVVHLTETECPAARAQYESFKKLNFTLPSFDLMTIDAPNYEFKIRALGGNMDFNILESKNPLVLWAQETRRALEVCLSSRLQKTVPNID